MYEEIYEEYKKVAKDNIDRPLFNNSDELNEEMIEDIKNSKIAIYTAFTGNYDVLKEPEFIDENCDYICFTDNEELESDVWEIRKMEDSFLDNNRKAKQYKVFPNKYLPEYKYSFWLDGTFKIKGSIREYIYSNLKKNSNMLNVIHTERDCVYKEYEASKIIPRYPGAIMKEQIDKYENEGFPKEYGLAVMGAIFRKHNDQDIIDLMNGWWNEIVEFSNQDQLSFAYVAWKQDFHPSVSLIYYWDNQYWAKEEGEYHHNELPVTPLTIDNLKEKLLLQLKDMDLNDKVDLSREETYLLVNNFKAMTGYRTDTIDTINFLDKEYKELMSSNSLKVTKPLRAVGNVARKIKSNNTLSAIHNNENDIYKAIKNLNLIIPEKYLELHPSINPDEVVLDYIRNGSVKDSIDEKYSYVNPLFDLFYYISSNNLSEDPIIHYVSKGFDSNLEINSREEGFVKTLDEAIDNQYKEHVQSKIRNELDKNNYITDSKVLIPYIEGNETYGTDTIKVGVFLEDSFDNMNACPFIRLHTPFKELSKSGDYHFFVYGKELLPQIDMDSIINNKIFDVIVLQRSNPYSTEILKRAKKLGIKIIYETDDFLLDIKKDNPSYNVMQKLKPGIIRAIDNADVITTSTTKIAEKFKKIDKDTEIIRNYQLNNVVSPKPFKPNKTLKIGYFGTFTHNQDLKLIESPIREIKKKYPNVEFEVVGISEREGDWFTTKKLPYYPMSAPTFMKWLANEVDWDIGVAPLVDNDFNSCKSELKYIEYTALGIPTVASDIEGYREAITDGVNGFLAKDNYEWGAKLSRLIDDQSFRHGMVNNARENVLENYNLNSKVKQWDSIFKNLFK